MMMQVQSSSSTVGLDAVVERILDCGQLTSHDRSLLESAILSQKFLNRTQQSRIARVYDGLHQGYISVID
jgi:hypothetical protein